MARPARWAAAIASPARWAAAIASPARWAPVANQASGPGRRLAALPAAPATNQASGPRRRLAALPAAPATNQAGSGPRRRLVALLSIAALVAGACNLSGSGAAPTPTNPASPTAALTATPTDTPTPTATPTASPSPSPSPSPTPTPVPTPPPTASPLPALAIGLCTGQQLQLSITLWEGSTGTSYAHITATNVSSGSCNMRGTSRAQILDGHGSIIGDAGSGGAEISTADPVYSLAPNGAINTIVTWGNWCKSAPAQKVTVSMVLPFGLGRITAPPLGDGPIPMCYSSSQKTQVSAEAWLP